MVHLPPSTKPVSHPAAAMRRFAWRLGFLLGLLFCVISLRGTRIAARGKWIPGAAISAHPQLPTGSRRHTRMIVPAPPHPTRAAE